MLAKNHTFGYVVLIGFLVIIGACKPNNTKKISSEPPSNLSDTLLPIPTQSVAAVGQSTLPYPWVELNAEKGYILDLRYATTDNFTGQSQYTCGRCFVTASFAEKLRLAQHELAKQYDYKIKLFDCYRPHSVQKALWDAYPSEIYVAHPDKGSMHNRGVAIDMTLVDKHNVQLDMGTDYDHFGVEAHRDNQDLSLSVQANRKILRTAMERNGFRSITSEWWHYSLPGTGAPINDWQWPCE